MPDPIEALLSDEATDPRPVIEDLHPADIATLLEGIPPERRRGVWDAVPPQSVGETLTEVSDGVREDLLGSMDPRALVEAVRTLDIDDVADLVPHLPEEVVAELQFTVDKEARTNLDTVLAFPEDTAGGLMNVDTITVRAPLSLATVLRYLRLRGEVPEYTDKLFVVDRENHLRGILFVSTLLTADASQLVARHYDAEPIKFPALTPADEVAQAFERYNLISAPVVDEHDRLLGRITIDDVVDVIREAADHTVLAQAGLPEEEDLFAPVGRAARRRALWLGVNLVTAFVASWVIGQFEETIEQLVALAVLMPIIASMGGNAGTQTMTIIIRGLGTGTVTRANAAAVLRKELLVGGLNGIVWALAVAVVAIAWYDNYALGGIIAAAMIINVIAAGLAGVLLPITFGKLGIDPALASGVALTTVTDVVGFLSVLGLAALLIV